MYASLLLRQTGTEDEHRILLRDFRNPGAPIAGSGDVAYKLYTLFFQNVILTFSFFRNVILSQRLISNASERKG